MATTSVLNSTLVGLYVDGALIGRLTDTSMNISHDAREISSKSSAGWKEFLEGMRGATFDFSAWYTVDETTSFATLFALVGTRTKATIKIASSVSGDKYYQQDGWLSNLSLSSPSQEDNVQYTGSFQGTGSVTEGSVL